MSFFILGDIHLRDEEEGVDWSYNYKGLISFLESLSLSGTDTFIQVGDFFDKPKHRGQTNHIALKAVEIMSKCKEVYLLQGNHDCTRYSGSNLDLLSIYPKVKIIKEIKLIETDLGKCLFLPYIEGLPIKGKYEEKVNEYMKNKGDVNYIFGHHFFKELSIMGLPYLDIYSFNFKFDHIIQGHVHQFSKLSNNYCVGSFSQCNKGERNQKKFYLEIKENEIEEKEIDSSYYINFVEIEWGKKEYEINSKDFVLVKCFCKKEEKSVVEQEIRKKFSKNLYFIDWIFPEEDKSEVIEMKNMDDLINKFFIEKKVTKKVKELFYSYV